jgi:NDP-sugar pyrophosphorylase family protein
MSVAGVSCSSMRRTPISNYGYDFISGSYVSEGQDEYVYRNEQTASWNAKWRHLTDAEVLQLEQQGNTCPRWDTVFVEDPIDLSLIRRNLFYGLVRIGSMEPYVVSYHDFALPEGVYDSHIISSDIGRHSSIHRCAYISHYCIGEQCLLNEIDEMDATNHAKFGNGIVKIGEDEDVRIKLSIMNEAETRAILPFESMICADAWLWGTYREKRNLDKRLSEITQQTFPDTRGWYAEVGPCSVIKSCRVIKDVRFGSHVYVKGANKLKNLTIRSDEQSPSQIGEGVELVNGIIGYGCHVFYGVKAVRFVLGNNSNLKYGARLLNSVLGDNSTISCCEVLNTLVFPFHEQHHNNSFLIASLVMGQSNMAAGANIGSNHNTRGNDGEMQAKRGFWPALSSSLKFNSAFASFTLITKGDYPNELSIPVPFAMVSYREVTNQVTIMPAYWWMYNRYALERNAWKFKKRDSRVYATQHIETGYIAPDTIEEIEGALDLLSLWVGRAALSANLIPSHLISDDASLRERGKLLLETHPEQVSSLEVIADGIERSHTPALILKPVEGYRAYQEMLIFGCMRIVLDYCDAHDLSIMQFQTSVMHKIHEDHTFAESISGPFRNMGGQLVSEPRIFHLIQRIEEGFCTSWQQIHDQYDQWWEDYPLVKATVALQALQRVAQTVQLDADSWAMLISRYLVLCDQNALEVYHSRKKDYEDPFRKVVYRNDEAMEAVLGRPEDASFVQESKITMEQAKEVARRFSPWS